MKRFLLVVCLGFLGAVTLFWGIPIVRIALRQPCLDEAFTLPEGTTVLCLGDSRVGCTFVEEPTFHNRVLWTSSISYRIRLGLLRNLRRLGQLHPGMTLISEVGPHEFAHYTYSSDWQLQVRGRALSVNWRYPDLWPSAGLLLDYLTDSLPRQRDLFFRFEHIDADSLPLPERPQEERLAYTQTIITDICSPITLTEKPNQALRHDLLALRQFCAENDLRLILFTAPLDSWYRAQVPSASREYFAALQRWLREQGFTYHDCSQAAEDFWMRDAVHLRLSGAKRFTRWFFERYVLTNETTPPAPPELAQ